MPKTHQVEISVVVPVYNAKGTIDRCVKSLVEQRTCWSYEVLLIDDGSTDSSLERLREWERRNNIIRVFSQANVGPSAARNKGIMEAKGRYLIFVDSDDWVEPFYIEHLRNSVIEEKHGVVVAGLVFDGDNGQKKRIHEPATFNSSDYNNLLDGRRMFYNGFTVAKIYELDGDDRQLFEPDVHFSEDLIYFLQCLKKADYVRFISDADYHYVQKESGSLITQYNGFESELAGYLSFRKHIIDLQRQYRISDEELKNTLGYVVHFMMRAIRTMYRDGKHFLPRSERVRRLAECFDDDDRAFAYRHTRRVKGIDNLIGYFMMRREHRLLDAILWLFFRLRCSSFGNRCVKWYLRAKTVAC